MNKICARLFFVPALLLAGFVIGCSSVAQQAPTGPLVAEVPKEQVVVEKDYKYVTRLGSHIPVRVPKSGVTRHAPGASPVETLSPEVLQDLATRPMSRPR